MTNGPKIEFAPQPLTQEALCYTWRQLAQRVGIAQRSGSASISGFEEIGVKVHYGRPERGMHEPPAIIVVPTKSATWNELLKASPHSLTWLPVKQLLPQGAPSPLGRELPVLFWGDVCQSTDRSPVERWEDGSVVFCVDIIATAFFMLSRWEETVVPTRDEHGRFPAKASVAYKQGFLDRPIVDEYALILRAWLQIVRPNWEPEIGPATLQLTHDVDRLLRFPNWWKGLRTFAGDLIKRRSIDLARGSGVDTLARLVNPAWDGFYNGIHKLVRISKDYGLNNDIFYFMTADPGPFDQGYDATVTRSLVKYLIGEGFQIGLHPSYEAFEDPLRLLAEKRRMDRILGMTEYGGRHHYLRFRTPETWQHFEEVGLNHDATMAYAEQSGFRCGSCHAYHPFDVENDCQLGLLECPLVVMDGAVKSSQTMTPDQAEAHIMKLAKSCESVQGTFTLLWHNSSFGRNWRRWAQMYERLVGELVGMIR